MVQLTMLNSMGGAEFRSSLEVHKAWGMCTLDLKDWIFGKSLLELSDDEAQLAADLIREQGLSAYCLSTTLFHPAVELGEDEFRRMQLVPIERAIAIAKIFQPKLVRLLAAQTTQRGEVADSVQYLKSSHPWVIPMYGEAIDRLHDAGCRVTIENETGQCIFSRPEEVLGFFAALDRSGKVHFTWDVQNMWEVGTFPSLDAYHQLKPLIDYFHLKGGQCGEHGNRLQWRSSLEDASWPVLEITRQAVADGISPVICLNPSHGSPKPDYDYADVTKRDIDFLRREIPDIV